MPTRQSATLLVAIAEELYRTCEDTYERWREHVELQRNCRVVETLVIPEGTMRSDLRSRIIRKSREKEAHGQRIDGIQIFGLNVDTFWFILGGYCFQTDAVYGNWPSSETTGTTWEDSNLDTYLSEDEFPATYRQDAWVGRWAGMNVLGEPEAVLFRPIPISELWVR